MIFLLVRFEVILAVGLLLEIYLVKVDGFIVQWPLQNDHPTILLDAEALVSENFKLDFSKFSRIVKINREDLDDARANWQVFL